jgi:osmoprotectant transport system permease protein
VNRARPGAWISVGVLGAVLTALTVSTDIWRWGLARLFPATGTLLYPRADPSWLVGEHMLMVAVSSLMAIVVGVGTGILVTRPRGRQFLPVAERLAAIVQTFPPAAVLALSVPALGFGLRPTIAALFLYSVLPIMRNTLEGLAMVPADSVEAARGMGMTPGQVLGRVELPLSLPVILAGVRTSVIVNVGTATIGATIGAGGLGAPIISGLVNQNPAFLTEGTVIVALLALTIDSLFAAVEGRLIGGVRASEPSRAAEPRDRAEGQRA